MRLTHLQLVLVACGISTISLVVAVVSIVYATNRQAAHPMDLIPAPEIARAGEVRALTPDNPAYQLKHTQNRLTTVGGLVISISPSAVVLGPESASQTIRITSATEIYLRGEEKSKEEYDKEFAEFDKLLKSAVGTTEIFVAPDRYRNTPISVADIAAGDLLLVKIDDTSAPVAVTIYKLPKTQ